MAPAPDGPSAPQTMLISDGDTPLGRALVRLYRQQGRHILSTYRAEEAPEPGENGSELLRAPRGMASPVAARNVVLKALTSFERLDIAIVTFAPSLRRVLLHEADYGEIDQAVDEWMRSTLFLLRELLACFVQQGSGVLALARCFPSAQPTTHPPLEAMVRGSLLELTSSLVASYGAEQARVYGFETSWPGVEEYARFIADTLAAAWERPPRRRSFHYRGPGPHIGGLRIPLFGGARPTGQG